MIFLKPEDLTSQEGMERAFQDYLERVRTAPEITFNGMVGASLYSCDFAGREVVFQVETKPWMENPNDVVHGGVSAAMLDMTMGALCRYFTGGGMAPTVSMQVNYLRATPVNETVLLRARLPMLGHTLCHVTAAAWVLGREDELTCTASGVYYVKH